MIIRPLEGNENWKSAVLGGIAFLYPVNIEEAKQNEEKKAETIGAFKDDNETLMAQIVVIEYESYFCGHAVKSVGIAGVATFPEYRRNGCVRKIFEYIFNIAPERGWLTSFLYPFSFRYYRKFGYENVVRHKTVNATFESMTHIPSNQNAVLYRGDEKHLADLLQVYNSYAAKHNVMFKRTDGKCFEKNPNSTQNYVYIWYDNDGEPCAMASVQPSEHQTLAVNEIAYSDINALKGILGFLRLYDGQFKNIKFVFLADDSPLEYILDTDRSCGFGAYDGAMGRIIDFEAMFKLNSYPTVKTGLSIKIYGDVIEKNNNIYDIFSDNGVVTVNTRKTGDYDIAASVCTMSKIMFGSVPEYGIDYMNELEIIKKGKDFKKSFPKRPVTLYERF